MKVKSDFLLKPQAFDESAAFSELVVNSDSG